MNLIAAREFAAARTFGPTVLVDEVNHRAANEAAVAIAAMRAARGMADEKRRDEIFDRAIGRLEGFADVCRILCRRIEGQVDAAASVREICCALARSRPGARPVDLRLELSRTVVSQAVVTVLCMVACELVTNAFKHAVRDGGSLQISLRADNGHVTLIVADDGPGFVKRVVGERRIDGQGTRILAELANDSGGTFDTVSGAAGSSVTFTLPLGSALSVRGRAGSSKVGQAPVA